MSKYCGLSFLVVLAVVLYRADAFAQWQQIAHHLYNPTPSGAVCYKDGLIWIGNDQFFMSSDTGKTWTNFPLPDPAMNGIVYDLKFFDRSTGIAALPGGTYRTTDQGVTWTLIKFGIPYGVSFGTTSQIIATAEDAPFGFNISVDGGATWKHQQFGQVGLKIMGLKNGSFVGYSGTPAQPRFLNSPHGGYLYVTSDYGVSWIKRKGNNPNFDCWDFDIDSCDLGRIYLGDANDAGGADSLSNIYVSNDSGDTWVVREPQLSPFFTGALAVSRHAVYAQSRAKGIYRSKDYGVTWQSIGGPHTDPNTRMISAINDNLLIATDDNGSVYRTNNSGGDSIKHGPGGSYSYTPESLLFLPPVTSCEPPLLDTLALHPHCSPAGILNLSIVGADSLHFQLQSWNGIDTVKVFFLGGVNSEYHAKLRVELDDGSNDEISLLGYGKYVPPFTLHTADVSTDTVGGDALVPVYIHGGSENGEINFRLSYDTSILIYSGAFLSNDLVNDHTASAALGHALITIPSGAVRNSDSLVGYIRFNVFPTKADSCATVRFDSISITNKNLACQSSVGGTSANVCGKLGCGISDLSSFLRYRRFIPFSTQPNPTNGLVTITTKDDIGYAQITLRDEQGIVRISEAKQLLAVTPSNLDCRDLPSGSYWITISGNGYNSTQKLLIVR